VSHFFAALQIASFRNPAAFRHDMDRMLADLRNSPPAEGATRVYFAGLKELESEAMCQRRGVPLTRKVYDQLVEVGTARGVTPPRAM
jgi:LDH2 family malate/lactate/ureidoglycolate dehydrogenase